MKGFRKSIAKALVLSIVLLNINSSIGYTVQGSTFQPSPYSTLANINNVVIFIDFNDTSSFNGDEAKARKVEGTYNDFLDSNNDGTSDDDKISVKSYIYDLTNGRTTVNSHFYPKSTTSNGYNSFKASKNKSDYSKIVMGSKDEKDFISTVFDSVKDEINLSDSELDQDNDGKIDSVTFIFSGLPGSGSSMLRPHKTEITQNNPNLKGKNLSKYNIIAEGSNNVNIYSKGVLSTIVHEYLHMLGYPDLYRDGQSIKPVGVWDIMGDTVRSPQLPLVYSRNTYGGANLGVEEITESGSYTLSNSSSSNAEDTVAFKVKSKEYPKEYFIIEYRKNNKKWDDVLPGSGMLVYRINENINPQVGNNSNNGNHIYIFRPGETIVNAGGGNINEALLSQNIGRNSLGEPITNTNFKPNSIYFADGVNSGIVISQVGNSDSDNITFEIEIPNNEIVGDGSIKNPYEIKNPRDLNLIANHPQKHFILTNNIDLSGVESYPVDSFSGTIDGKGYKISNMTINSNSDTTGFISSLSERGSIKNISFENVNVKSAGWTSGTVVGTNLGTVDNVKVSGRLESSSDGTIGGIVGENSYGIITNSTSNVNITSLSDVALNVGGISGNSYNNITKNNYFSGTIVSQPSNKVGGIFGRMILDSLNENTASIDNLWNKSNSNLEKGVGETIITDKNITLVDLEKGVVSVELLKDITLDKDINNYSNDLVKYNKALQNPTENLKSSNEAVVKVEGKKAKAIGSGNAKIIYNLLLGTNEINEEINVTVIGNELPEIIAANVEIKVGETFEPLKNVTAIDKEDGSLTSKIKVLENTVDTTKAGTYKVIYQVEDSKGAKTTKEIVVKVVQPLIGMNNVPNINANNIELKVGDAFDPMKSVKAEDKEDGSLTSKIKVIENTVDTTKVGTYKVIYQVEDSNGAKSTKEIVVKVTQLLVEINNATHPDEIIDHINKSQNKEIEIQVTSDNRVIDASIFKGIKGTEKNIKLVQDDGTVWIFEGKDIKGDNFGNVTIKVSNVAAEENQNNIEKIDSNAKIIHFDHHGQLPGKATVKVKIDNPEDVMGKELTLYYYNEVTKKPEKVQGPLLVDENGYVTVEITHCSDYFLSANDSLGDSNEKPVIGMNNIPVINANDVEIKVGETFDPLKNITATDKEDGDLTSKIKVIENTVDTTKAGTYKVVYQVEDREGAKSTNTITVIVKANEDTENKNEEDNIEEGKTEVDKQNEEILEKLPATGQPIRKMTIGIVSITLGFVLVRRKISRDIKSKV